MRKKKIGILDSLTNEYKIIDMDIAIKPRFIASNKSRNIGILDAKTNNYSVYKKNYHRNINYYRDNNVSYDKNKRIIIVGSDATACLLASEINHNKKQYGRVIGYINNINKKGRINGIKVLGDYKDIYSVTHKYKVDEVLLVLPTNYTSQKKEIIHECIKSKVKTRIYHSSEDNMNHKISINNIRDVEIYDIYESVKSDYNLSEVTQYIENKVIMVTGGSGEIGSEICWEICRLKPKKLIVLDISEKSLYEIQIELKRQHGDKLNLEFIIGSVQDKKYLLKIIKENKVDVIFHAAAYKNIHLLEQCPSEAIKNNVFGTMNIAEAAHEMEVERFILLSDYNAQNPVNLLGASKRISEMIIKNLNNNSITKFVSIRFGNVLGTTGSVIPLFERLIKEGGPVTVTHPDIIRYFITIHQVSQLVLLAGQITRGGDIFIVDMGKPVKILTLAEDLIKLHGLEPYKDIDIQFTGLRPGEKLYDELLFSDELISTKCRNIFKLNISDTDYSFIKKSLLQLKEVVENEDYNGIHEQIKLIIGTYPLRQDDEYEKIKRDFVG